MGVPAGKHPQAEMKPLMNGGTPVLHPVAVKLTEFA